MPDQDNTNNTNNDTNPTAPLGSADMPADSKQPEEPSAESENMMKEIANKISEVHNILIALSSDPSVDEIAAAIGLSMCLDRAGKRATSIYSGKTPNALEFLKPEETFQTTADVLQDFVIALNKEKADHLRYKLDGDFVKIFITPYKSRIDDEDLEFSYGDFNIEFVLALNVANGIDLDDALREHGRVMHDAAVANITTGNPGKFGDIEWSDKTASSVSEMAAKLLYSMGGKDALSSEEATAFMTGIVSATDHFSNAKTTAMTMQVASELMKSGADRQLITDNISLDSDNNMLLFSNSNSLKDKGNKEDSTSLTIDHDDNGEEPEAIIDKAAEPEEKPTEEKPVEEKTEDSELLADLQAAAAGLASAGDVTTPEVTNKPLNIDSTESGMATSETAPEPSAMPTPILEPTTPTPSEESAPAPEPIIPTIPEIPTAPAPEPLTPTAPSEPTDFLASPKPETTLTPSADFTADNFGEGTNKYGQMLEEALAEANGIPNPAASAAPVAPTEPEINGVPEINYAPLPNEEILPPPPTPPIDFSSNIMPPQIPNNP